MCTLIFWYRAFNDYPLIVAANRDERLDRPAKPPSLRQLSNRTVLCPTDLVAGGTWLGLNDRGVFVAITNRFGTTKHGDRRSRGEIVLQALDQESAAAAAATIGALDPAHENGFHLAIADKHEAHAIVCDGVELNQIRLEPGLHIMTERSFRTSPTVRESRIRTAIAKVKDAPSDELLKGLLASHDQNGFEGICVHVPELNYGTRSSTILRIGSEIEMQFADGPPHQTPYVAMSSADYPAIVTGGAWKTR